MKTTAPAPTVSVQEVHLEIPIAAPVARVWDALVEDTTLWWPRSFYATSSGKRFVIEPKVGGRVFEDTGKGEGLLWYTVIGVERGKFLQLSGSVIPPFGGPGTCFLRLTLTENGPSETKLQVDDHAFGQLASYDVKDGWRQVFGDGLARHVEAALRKG